MNISLQECKPLCYFLCFILSLLLSYVFVSLLIRILPKLGILDKPDERKIHKKPIPRMGGLGICLAFIIPMIVLMYFDNLQKAVIVGALITLIVGMLDDILGVKATIKLLIFFVLTLILRVYGLTTNLPFEKIGLNKEIANIIITLFWIVGVTSAINALDHMDGLAGGISLIASLSYFAVALQTSNFFWGLVSICLAGAILGFLYFNWHPAKIFMGDSGSFFLGFTLASLGVMGGWSENPLKSAVIPLLILSLPIFDLVYVIFSRHLNGTTKTITEAIVYCGKDHIGHRLMRLGLKQRTIAIIIYIFSATVSISALTIKNASLFEVFLLLFQIFLIYLFLVLLMRGFEIKKRNAKLVKQ